MPNTLVTMAMRSIVGCSAIAIAVARGAESPDYGRDVRPILSQYCFKCHGPDETKREAEMRLDLREEATRAASSGERPIVPTEPASSELIRRIRTDDPDLRMPPASTKLQLSKEQKETLRAWIAAGAEYSPHWSFVAPRRPVVPNVRHADWTRGAIDRFIVASLEAEKLSPSPEADRHSLVRRVSLDLIGLPPSIEEAEEFVADRSPDAYEKLVDRLLASPHYGERWARRWLDLARYADTNCYEKDRQRSVWPYRDWVINALNSNLPFDQFTVEQLAGDMLPGATEDQRIATGFHRNTMLNEEGGIDPLEFRFHAMTDRVATTSTVWMGLTLGCAQCHTHKYDPITHRDYYSMFALLNNADEPEMDVSRADISARRVDLEQRIALMQEELPSRFPPPDEFVWTAAKPVSAKSLNGAQLSIDDEAAVFASGPNPETDIYEVAIDSDLNDVVSVRLETLVDSRLPSQGPGRTPHGNFVLSEFTATAGQKDGGTAPQSLKFVRATADFSQDNFPVEKSIDGEINAGGWAIHGPGEWHVNRVAVFVLEKPAGAAGQSTRWTIRIDQKFGKQHTIGKFRISLGRRDPIQSASDSNRRSMHFNRKFVDCLKRERDRAVAWTRLKPLSATSNLPLLTIEPDDSIFASGDMSKHDTYDVSFEVPDATPTDRTAAQGDWTALRIEALPDDRLPKKGPGRVYYEGPFGDFFLSEIRLKANGQIVPLTGASQSFANGGNTAAMALDGNQQTGWSISGGQGKSHVAVFRFVQPVARNSKFDLTLLCERYYAAGLGRFRVSVTDDARPVEASSFPLDLEPVLLAIRDTDLQGAADASVITRFETLVPHFCETAVELANERQSITKLRSQLPEFPTTLVFQERPANNPRVTRRHQRGEFLQPKEIVEPAMVAALPSLPADQPANRLTFARWLVSADNPLAGRVTANREWAAFFGRGLVRTLEDFGSQGASPTHPELLDWLAVELGDTKQSPPRGTGWDIKRLHRLITTSSTYRQASRTTPELLVKDPHNELLARGTRLRLEAEIVRDTALAASGLLSHKLRGPSVFPVQPPNVTTEGTYGGLAWNVSPGEDRYRRTLYTFSKRTAPFAMSLTFDAPSGEACIARREVTNTPLQALTLLNDAVFVEAAQALGREFAAHEGPNDASLRVLFQRCLTRPPSAEELELMTRFFDEQRSRIQKNELDAAALAGAGGDNVIDRAAWTIVARAILNLDEAVTRN